MKYRHANHKKNTKIYPGKPSWGRKPNKNSSIQMYQKYKYKTPNKCSFSQHIYISLSPMHYTQVCVQMRNTTPLFILFLSLEFYPNKSAPTNLLGEFTQEDTKQYYIIFKRVLFTRLTMQVIPHDSMMTKYNSNIPMEEQNFSYRLQQ